MGLLCSTTSPNSPAVMASRTRRPARTIWLLVSGSASSWRRSWPGRRADGRQGGRRRRVLPARPAREPGEPQPETSERVDRGDRAAAVMAATAEAAPELKRMAGGSAVGRKLEKPVCHYSLNWAPDETPDRQEMSRAVDESLKALGLEKHQALIVAPVHFAAGARQTAAPWAGARARRRVRAMTKPYGSSLPPALWAINEEAGPSRPSSRTSSRIRRARSPENSAAGRPPRASIGATRGLGRPAKGGKGGGRVPRRPRTSRRADGRALRAPSARRSRRR